MQFTAKQAIESFEYKVKLFNGGERIESIYSLLEYEQCDTEDNLVNIVIALAKHLEAHGFPKPV